MASCRVAILGLCVWVRASLWEIPCVAPCLLPAVCVCDFPQVYASCIHVGPNTSACLLGILLLSFTQLICLNWVNGSSQKIDDPTDFQGKTFMVDCPEPTFTGGIIPGIGKHKHVILALKYLVVDGERFFYIRYSVRISGEWAD